MSEIRIRTNDINQISVRLGTENRIKIIPSIRVETLELRTNNLNQIKVRLIDTEV